MPDFEQLLQQNRHRFIAIANAYARHDDRDDLLQEILLQIWRGLSSYRGQAALATWCYRVALNTALGWQRSAGRRSTRIPISDSEVQTVADRSSVSDPYQMLQQFIAHPFRHRSRLPTDVPGQL